VLKKIVGEKYSQRHLTPDNLRSLKGRLSDQLEVIRSSVKSKILSNLSWKVNPEISTYAKELSTK